MTTSTALPTTIPATIPTTRTTTVLVTGATRGLGLETTRRLSALGWTVWLGCRDAAAGEDAAAVVRAAQPDADVRPLRIDVTDDASVAAAYDVVVASGTGLDVLVNNAGIAGGPATTETVPADFLPVFGVNVLGPVRVTHAFLPLLTAAEHPRLVMVSSGLGSIALVNDPERIESQVPGMVYQASKAALNMVANQYARDLPGVRVTSVDPGYTATDLNGHSGPQSVTEGTDAVVTAASAEVLAGPHIDRYGALAR